MARRICSDAQLEWVRNNIKNANTISELYELSKKELAWSLSLKQFKSLLKNNKIPTEYKKIKSDEKVFWNLENIRWLKENAPGNSRQEILNRWNATHEHQLTLNQIVAAMKNYHITNGLDGRFKKGVQNGTPIKKGQRISVKTEFKKGNVPHNRKNVGTISTRIDKRTNLEYYWVKTGENKWEMLHRVLWKESNGNIPSGCVVTFIDGNQKNCNIKNLALITKAENIAIMRCGFPKRTKEEFEAIKLIADIKIKSSAAAKKMAAS